MQFYHMDFHAVQPVSIFFSFSLWTPGMLYLDCSNTSFSLWTPAVCDSSCLTGYEPCALVAPKFSSPCCLGFKLVYTRLIGLVYQLGSNLLSSWNHTAGVHSEKLKLEQSKYNIPGVHSEKLKNALTVELQL